MGLLSVAVTLPELDEGWHCIRPLATLAPPHVQLQIPCNHHTCYTGHTTLIYIVDVYHSATLFLIDRINQLLSLAP
jgi:hypothetical protein